MVDDRESLMRNGRRKKDVARKLLLRLIRGGIQSILFPKVICPSDVMALVCLLSGLLQKGWTVWSAAVVFIVGHHIRDPYAFADWVRQAPKKILHPGDASRWLRSLALPEAKYWLGCARFCVGPEVIADWLLPSHEGALIASGQALADILFGSLTVDKGQEILERLPHVKGYGHHIMRSFGDAVALACHLKLYKDVPRSLVVSRFSTVQHSRNMSKHVSILWKLTDMGNCKVAYPREAKCMGKTGVLTAGDKALVLCELSEMLGTLGVLPKQASLTSNTSVVVYASGIKLRGLKVLGSFFSTLQRPLCIDDLGKLGEARYEDAAVNDAFAIFLAPLKVRHHSVIALNMSSLIPADVKQFAKQDARGGDHHCKRKRQ